MSKYTDIESKPGNDTEWMLQIIANELAETNRIARIKLKEETRHSIGTDSDGFSNVFNIADKDLEDQA